MPRNQFTFYRSYYEALKNLPQKDQTKVFMAVCAYALDDEPPTLSGVPLSVFTLIRPTLDSGRNKALNRQNKMKTNEQQTKNKQRTNKEQTKNKRTTNKEQIGKEIEVEKENEREKEVEVEVESEVEGENDSSSPDTLLTSGISPPSSGAECTQSKPEERFERFWEAYPRKVGKQAALKAWKKLAPDDNLTEKILSAVAAQKHCQQWTKDCGQFIPHPTTWLNQGRWEDEVNTTEGREVENGETFVSSTGAVYPKIKATITAGDN